MTNYFGNSFPGHNIVPSYDYKDVESRYVTAYGDVTTIGQYSAFNVLNFSDISLTATSPEYIYQTSTQTRAANFEGFLYTVYDGGGFVKDIAYGNSSQAYANIANMKDTFLTDRSVAMFVHTFFYNPNYNVFVTFKMSFEILPTGVVHPSYEVRAGSIFSAGTANEIFQSFTYYLSIVGMLFCLVRAVLKIGSMFLGYTIRQTSLALWYLYDIGVVALFVYAVITHWLSIWSLQGGNFPRYLLRPTKIYDFESVLANMEKSDTIIALVFVLYSFRIFRLVVVSAALTKFTEGFAESYAAVLSFVVTILAFIALFSSSAWVISGTTDRQTDYYPISFVSHLKWFIRGFAEIEDEKLALILNAQNFSGRFLFELFNFVMRCTWIAVVINVWMSKEQMWRETQLGKSGMFVGVKRTLREFNSLPMFLSQLRKSVAQKWRVMTACCRSSKHSLKSFEPSIPDASQMNLAFERWRKRSDALQRFPFLTEDNMAAYIRDDEKLHKFLEPIGGIKWSAARFFAGLSDQENATMSASEVSGHIEVVRRSVHMRSSKIIAKRLFRLWHSLWTPLDYAMKKYERETSSDTSLQAEMDPVQMMTAAKSIIAMTREFDVKAAELRSILRMIHSRQRNLSHALELICEGIDAAIRASDQDEWAERPEREKSSIEANSKVGRS